MSRAVQVLKPLADPTRLRIVRLLHGREELCVCEIVEALDVPQYSVSRHLAVLKAAGLTVGWRQGKWMHYGLARRLSADDRALLAAICRRAGKEAVSRRDERRMRQHLRPRVNGAITACPR